MNHYKAFNDSFECWAEVITGFPNKSDKSERLFEIYKAWGFNSLEEWAANELYDKYAESLINKQPDIDSIIDNARITCFSKRADNLLMWSHYANGLRGFCIEFDPDLLLINSSDFTHIYEVEYKDKPSIIDTALIAVIQSQIESHIDILDCRSRGDMIHFSEESYNKSLSASNDIFVKMLATKPIDWKYEEEMRIITQLFIVNEASNFLKYPPQAIKSVIFGEKMPPKQLKTLANVFSSSPFSIELKTAKRSKGEFKVLISDGI